MIYPSYGDLALIVVLLTLVLSLVIGRNVPRENFRGIDGLFAALGFLFGLFMTCMNLVYTSNALFLLSPIIAISCMLYLRYRSELKGSPHFYLLELSNRNSKILSIIWWFLIAPRWSRTISLRYIHGILCSLFSSHVQLQFWAFRL